MADIDSSQPVKTRQPGDIDTFISDPNTPANKLKINSEGSIDSRLLDGSGDAYTPANPLPVEFFESQEEISSFEQSDALAKDSSENHDYVTQASFKLKEVICSSEGASKFEVQVETAAESASFNTLAVLFVSPSSKNAIFTFQKGINVAEGATVRVIKTSRDNPSQFLYSTIVGVEV